MVAPSLIPSKPGNRVKTDRRDALSLAKLHRAGELTAVWVPDAAHEAMRDLIRARATAVRVLGKARQHLQGFLLRHGRIYAGRTTWTLAYRRWLATLRFAHPAQQIVLQDYIHAVQDAERRVPSLAGQPAVVWYKTPEHARQDYLLQALRTSAWPCARCRPASCATSASGCLPDRTGLAETIVAEAILDHLQLCGWRLEHRGKPGVTPSR